MNTRRLEAEPIRDAMLASVSGELDLTAGTGPAEEATRPRRSVYTKVRRNKHDPLLDSFDAPDGSLSAAQRNATTTPTQALLMINGALDARPRPGLRRPPSVAQRPMTRPGSRKPTAWPSAGRLSPMSSTRLWRTCATRDSKPAVRRRSSTSATRCQMPTSFCTLIKERTIAQDYAGQKVAEILKRKKASVQQAPLPQGSPDWDTFTQMTWEQIEAGALALAGLVSKPFASC